VKLYADLPAHRARQLAADAVWLVCVVLAVLAGRAVHATIAAVSGPARRISDSSTALSDQLREAGAATAGAPLIGDDVAGVLDRSADTARSLARTATDQAEQVLQVATLLGVLTAALPVLLATGLRLRQRIRWARRARQAEALAATAAGERVLALRALQHRSAADLFAVHPDPAAAWTAGEDATVRALAAAEQTPLGLRGTPGP
jgi:hypothetical protein